MKLLILYQKSMLALNKTGSWGQRKCKFIRSNAPEHWQFHEHALPPALPVIIDDPTEFVPDDLPQCDLLLALSENPGVAELIPDFAEAVGAQAVIAPVDNRSWLPLGLQKQTERRLEGMGIAATFPAPFCTLQETDSDNASIVEFARYFGRPLVQIFHDDSQIKQVTVERMAPCGNTNYVAELLAGVSIRDAETRAGLLHHHHPCWASMEMDEQLGDTLMHQGGLMIKLAVQRALKEE